MSAPKLAGQVTQGQIQNWEGFGLRDWNILRAGPTINCRRHEWLRGLCLNVGTSYIGFLPEPWA